MKFRFRLYHQTKRARFLWIRYNKKVKTTLGNHGSDLITGRSIDIDVFLPAFKNFFHDEDKLIESISKTIAHEYVHHALSKQVRRGWLHEWAIARLGLQGF